MKERKKALIVGGGGLRGAYDIGVLKELYKYEKPWDFSAIYAVSVGVYASTFFTANQVDTMENTWLHYVHGNQLINFLNPLKGRSILDLDYLIEIFKSDLSRLKTEQLFKSDTDLKFVLTNYKTGLPKYFNAKSNNVFDLMKASSALPCVYTKKIIIDGERYIDGGISDPIPLRKVIEDGYSDILLVLNKPAHIKKPFNKLFSYLCLKNKNARNALNSAHKKWNDSEKLIEKVLEWDKVRLRVIRPKNKLKVKRLTREKETILDAIEQGKIDASNFLNQ